MRKSFRQQWAGFGLLEVILVFALVIGAAAITFTAFQSARPSADSDRATSDLTVLAANIKGVYAAGGNYSGIDTARLIQNGLVPTAMIDANKTGLMSTWERAVVVTPEAASLGRRFVIAYQGIPADACAKFLLGASPYFEDVSLSSNASDPGTPVRVSNGPVNGNTVATACAGNGPFVAFFTSK